MPTSLRRRLDLQHVAVDRGVERDYIVATSSQRALVAVANENEALDFHLFVGHDVLCQTWREVHFLERHCHLISAS